MSEIIRRCAREDIELVRLLYTGNDGVARGRVVAADSIETFLEDGSNLTKAMQSFTAFDQLDPDGPYGPAGEVRLVPDPATFRALPYADGAAVMLCDLYELDQTPWAADPRSMLQSYLADLADEGFEPQTAFESEFYYVKETDGDDTDGFVPLDDSLCFASDGMQHSHPIIRDTISALDQQGMALSAYYPELGPGQQELVIEHAPGIDAADAQVLYRETVKAVAQQHDVTATFVPKPFPDGPGSGCHIHLSLWDGETNVFHDPNAEGPYGLSDRGRHFIGGVLEHAPALLALTTPTVTSFHRLQPHMWASAYACWGQDNREAAVRVPSGSWSDPASSARIEFKPSDNTANPYLALLGLLAAGMDGIDRELDPGEPVNQDPGNLSEDERTERGIERFPETLAEAVDALEADAVLAEAMGETLHETYVSLKRSQWDAYQAQVDSWEAGSVTEWERNGLRRGF
ncbi:MAG: glutamine synthetase family protein [Halobacteriales archaeon]|nr:glutamine synthetase family protein [Halobacteriales archaeon]